MTILEQAKNLLETLPLCDHCLGRQFALLGHGLSNDKRGYAIKLLLVAEADRALRENEKKGKQDLMLLVKNSLNQVALSTAIARGFAVKGIEQKCGLCRDTFANLPIYAEKARRCLNDYEFESFLVGIRVPTDVVELEDELRARFNLVYGESIRNEFSREIGKRIQASTSKAVDLQHPQVLVMIDPFNDEVSLEINSIYISGRYRKFERNLPQSRWLCRRCQGRGCEQCGGTGKLYQESVEELIGIPAMTVAGGVGYHLHAAGREDVDVRTLGSGRPFVLEVIQPRKRNLNLHELTNLINKSSNGKVEVSGLKISSKDEVRRLKEKGQGEKTYRAMVEFDREIEESELERLKNALVGQPLSQLTPIRVMHRRTLKERKKYIYELEARKLQANRAELIIRCQGGLYIKEFISGDEGRTKPSVAEILGVSARCIELDVIDVNLGDSK
ncbi:MAG: tRNA pseudouridine(54/55) synthase Pus10 [Candidatus Bathyarchaeia archaeon]